MRDLVFKTELQNVVLNAASSMGYNTFDTDLNCNLGTQLAAYQNCVLHV